MLTTLVDQGVYPDPYFGLNNLSIPESLNKQDYWYRLEFAAPPIAAGQTATITFFGINYRAEIWLNGQRLGEILGAFKRGIYDVSRVLKPGGANVLAVRISPPPHPGIPHEQSIQAGAGPNGGSMVLDGPTFFCSEGWDWIPGIRDRNSGIWQDVVLKVAGAVTLGDPQVHHAHPQAHRIARGRGHRRRGDESIPDRPKWRAERHIRRRLLREISDAGRRGKAHRSIRSGGISPARRREAPPLVAERLRPSRPLPSEPELPGRRWQSFRGEDPAFRHA